LGFEGTDLGLEGLDPWPRFPSVFLEDFLYLARDLVVCCVDSSTKIMYMHIGSEKSWLISVGLLYPIFLDPNSC
jgi:hypothetical protein